MNRLIMFLTAIVLFGIAGFAVIWINAAPSPEKTADVILTDLSAGRYRPVWDAATPAYRARMPFERFRAVMADFSLALGAYREIAESRPGPDVEGEVALVLDVVYENGHADCDIVFLDVDGTPTLQSLHLRKAGGR